MIQTAQYFRKRPRFLKGLASLLTTGVLIFLGAPDIFGFNRAIMEGLPATNQAILVSTGTSVATSSVTVQNLAVAQSVANQCVQFGTGGLLTGSGSACGTVSGSAAPPLAVSSNTVVISSPTAIIKLNPNDFLLSLQVGATAAISLNPGTTNYIHNQTTPQSATLNISSGTISTLNATSLRFPDGTTLTTNATSYIFSSQAIQSGVFSVSSATIQALSSNALVVQSSVTTSSYIARFSTTPTSGFYALTVSTNNHVSSQGPPPIINSCGSSPSVATGSDQSGRLTTGTGSVTGCGIVFALPWANTPFCLAQTTSTVTTATVGTISASSMTVTFASSSPSHTLTYHCFGRD